MHHFGRAFFFFPAGDPGRVMFFFGVELCSSIVVHMQWRPSVGKEGVADLSTELVTDDGVRVPVCIEVFKGHTTQGATRFGMGLRLRRRFPIVFAVVLLADTVRSLERRQTLEGQINHSLDLEISQRNRAFYGASLFVYI